MLRKTPMKEFLMIETLTKKILMKETLTRKIPMKETLMKKIHMRETLTKEEIHIKNLMEEMENAILMLTVFMEDVNF